MTGATLDDEFDWPVKFYIDNIYSNGTGRPEFPVGGRFTHPATDSVQNTIDFLRHDVALAAADTLIVLAPFYSDLQTTLSLLQLLADESVPALGS